MIIIILQRICICRQRGTDSIENTRVSISKLIDEFKIDLVKSSVQEIRLHDKKVILEDGTLSYDYLVIGLGGEPETFGIPGLAEHAMTIRSINSVRLIREHIEYQFALYKMSADRRSALTLWLAEPDSAASSL